ncbi:MAG: twin-arginine translocase TatA/TatE family subunit [Armatimonadetes bacterium]|nr:twin-arginine translocase TatA/TatE family subunit [Armatimonadota bacterium]
MFGSIGPTELLVIMALALLFFGPKKLPEIGRSLGGALREFRRASQNFMDALNHPDLLLEDNEADRPPPKSIEFPAPPPVEMAAEPTSEAGPYGSDFLPADETASDGRQSALMADKSLASSTDASGTPGRKG